MDEENRKVTRYLGRREDAPPMEEQRVTGPLDRFVPWVIEFRVTGTTHILRARLSERLIIGRSDARNNLVPDVDVTPYAAHVLGVSRQHAEIVVNDNRLMVRDLNSANGTYLNDHVLEPGREYRLRHGDKLTLGRLHLQVFFAVTPNQEDRTQEMVAVDDAVPVIGSGQHILIVDDDTDVASVIGSILEHAGFKITIVGTAVEAMTLLGQGVPTCVVMEMLLPDMGGLEIVNYVRQRQQNTRLPVIVVSSATAGFQMGQALDAGVDIYLRKPVGIDELMQSIKQVLERMHR